MNASQDQAVHVHVVAWQYNGGAGFDWYRSQFVADEKYKEEAQNVDAFSSDQWTAFRFDVVAPSLAEVTEYIDANLDTFCQNATLRNGPMTFPFVVSE